MTVQHTPDVPAVITDAGVRHRVEQAVHDLDVAEATRYAIWAGVTPPTDEPGWTLRQRPDGLSWVHD